jgi:transposase
MKNKPLSRYKKRKISDCFSLQLTATETARSLKINRNTINRYYHLLREAIAWFEEKAAMECFTGKVEFDIALFGRRQKAAAGSPAQRKIPVVGFLKRSGKVSTQIVPAPSTKTLQTVITCRVKKGSVIYTDEWRSYDERLFDGFEHQPGSRYFPYDETERPHIAGIDAFWSFARSHLAKYYGSKPEYFNLYLKECEFRYNFREDNLSRLLWHVFTEFEKFRKTSLPARSPAETGKGVA